jgi:hypothetical protein
VRREHPTKEDFDTIGSEFPKNTDDELIPVSFEKDWIPEEYRYYFSRELAYRITNYFEWEYYGGAL